MRWYYLLIPFVFVYGLSLGLQTDAADSLKIPPSETSDIHNEIKALLDISKTLRSRDVDSANYYAELALELSTTNDYEYGLMVSHYNLGILFRIKGDYDKTLSHYFESLSLAKKLEDNYYEMALLNAIGVVHKIYGKNKLALKYFNECLNQIIGFHTPEALGSIKNNIGEVYLALNEYDSALKYGLASLRVRTKVNDTDGQVKTLNNLGKVYANKQNFDSAAYYLNRALALSKSTNNLLGQTETQIAISEAYLKAGKYEESILRAMEAETLAKALNAKFERLQAYKLLSDAYAKKLDYHEAFNYQKLAMALGDSIFNEEKEREISLLRLNREAAENELLKNKNELQEVTIQKQKVLNLSTIVILVIVFILGLVLLYLFLVKRKTNIILKAKAEELQHANVLKNKMLSIISHDVRAPLNNLYGLINLVKSGQVNEEEFQKWIGNLASQVSVTRNFLDSLLYWVRYQISHDLKKEEVCELKSILDNVIEILQAEIDGKGIRLKLDLDDKIKIKTDKEVMILVLKNLLSNAIKFSRRDGEIEIKASVKQHVVMMSIRDYGVGIEEDKLEKLFDFELLYTTKGTLGEVGTGLGLSFCKEFLELNGGKIWVESKVNEGSVFYLSMPLAK